MHKISFNGLSRRLKAVLSRYLVSRDTKAFDRYITRLFVDNRLTYPQAQTLRYRYARNTNVDKFYAPLFVNDEYYEKYFI